VEVKVLLSVVIGFMFVFGVCAYLYFMDKYDKENKRLLFSLLFMGALSGVLIYFLKELCGRLMILAFGDMVTVGVDASLVFENEFVKTLWIFINNFVVVSLIPIVLKFILAYSLTRKNKNFNSLFDGIIYLAYVFLGSLLTETICYAIFNGWDLFLFKLLMVACVDVFSAIIIGYYYTNWYTWKIASVVERVLNERGLIEKSTNIERKIWIFKGLFFGIMISTIYQYCGNNISGLIVIGISVIFAVYKVNDVSKRDMSDENIVFSILAKYYPYLTEKKDDVINIINEKTN